MSIISRLFSKSGTAVFEFLLIVVGVLAALAVDSWQQEQDEKLRLQGHLISLVAEVDQNLYSIGIIRTSVLPKKIERLGRVINTLESHSEPPELTDAFMADLVRSATDAQIWFTRNSYDALLSSGGFKHLNNSALESLISSSYSANETLLSQSERARGRYAALVFELVPSRFLTQDIHPMGGYVHEAAEAPLADDGMSLVAASELLFTQRERLVRLARNEMAYATGTWYALTRIEDGFEVMRERIVEDPLLQGEIIENVFDELD